ncbi:hypothetical protein [Streptomyces sp. NPDC006368]|uniref:hypothetical protein n=1 Tax=Streptomyces sp. NPDC006368 TaxID=3156760 RepID=UPI0033B0EB3B
MSEAQNPFPPARHGADKPGRIDGSGRVVQGQAPASGVSVPRHLGVGSDLVHSLDYVVMLQVMFNLASKIECTPTVVWRQLQERGIRSAKNANELVGKNAVYESFARLVTAGYLRRARLPHPEKPGRMGPVVYEAFDNPAWNPDWSPTAETKDHEEVKPQVGTLPGTPDVEFGEVDKTAGQNTSRNAGSGNATSGVPGRGIRGVSAGQNTSLVPGRRTALPPHPPEEEVTPPPPTPSSPSGSLPSQREEVAEFSPEETSAAVAFLQTMSTWQAGRATAVKCAPVLLRTMRQQGWPVITDMDAAGRELLEREIFKNTVGAKSFSRLLPGWVRDLRLYAHVRPAAAQPSGEVTAAAARMALVAACGRCDELGWVLDDDDDGPMRRCAHPGVTAGAEVAQ